VVSALAYFLAGYLVLVVPWAGLIRYRKLKERLAAGDVNARSRAYARGVIRQVVLVAAVLWIAFSGQIPASALGLGVPRSWPQTWGTLGVFSVAILFSSLWFRDHGDRQFNRLRKTIGAVLPISQSERWWFAAIGIGAGISEEFLYRGFLTYYLWVWLPGLDWMRVERRLRHNFVWLLFRVALHGVRQSSGSNRGPCRRGPTNIGNSHSGAFEIA
jgi:uncharacterized protein